MNCRGTKLTTLGDEVGGDNGRRCVGGGGDDGMSERSKDFERWGRG